MSPKLPHGWSESSIGQLFKLGTKGCNPSSSPRDQFLHYSIPSLDETGGPIIEMGKAIESNKFLLTEPCILVSKLNPRKSRVVVYRHDHDELPVCASTEFMIYIPNDEDEASIDYFAKYMASELFRRRLERIAIGTTNSHIRARPPLTLKWDVHVPPPPEQQVIARILDAVDAAIERTRTAIATADRLQRAVVQNFIEQGLGRISSADRPGKKLRKGWRLVPTGELLVRDPKNGISPVATPQPPGFPTFSIAAVRNGKIDLMNEDHRKYVRIRDEVAAEFAVKRGDLLVVRGNANPELVGKCGMVANHPDKCIYPDILKRVLFRDSEDGVLPEFACIVWNHAVVHNQVLKRAKTSNGTLKINSMDVKQIIMPVPPKSEQEQLVDLVGSAERTLQIYLGRDAHLERLKHGLMQDLLTGRVRVKLPASSGNGVVRSRT